MGVEGRAPGGRRGCRARWLLVGSFLFLRLQRERCGFVAAGGPLPRDGPNGVGEVLQVVRQRAREHDSPPVPRVRERQPRRREERGDPIAGRPAGAAAGAAAGLRRRSLRPPDVRSRSGGHGSGACGPVAIATRPRVTPSRGSAVTTRVTASRARLERTEMRFRSTGSRPIGQVDAAFPAAPGPRPGRRIPSPPPGPRTARARSACARSCLATTSRPDVPRSRRCTMPGRSSPPMPLRSCNVVQECIDEGAVRVAGGRMHDHARRLVDDDQIRVVVDDPRAAGPRDAAWPGPVPGGPPAPRHRPGRAIPGSSGGAVEPDPALPDQLLRSATGCRPPRRPARNRSSRVPASSGCTSRSDVLGPWRLAAVAGGHLGNRGEILARRQARARAVAGPGVGPPYRASRTSITMLSGTSRHGNELGGRQCVEDGAAADRRGRTR